jgi:hypothetical protein
MIPAHGASCNCSSFPQGLYSGGTNTVVHKLRFNAHALPGFRYQVLSSTNLVDWSQEGATNVLFGDDGVQGIVIGWTNPPPAQLFLRLKECQQ